MASFTAWRNGRDLTTLERDTKEFQGSKASKVKLAQPKEPETTFINNCVRRQRKGVHLREFQLDQKLGITPTAQDQCRWALTLGRQSFRKNTSPDRYTQGPISFNSKSFGVLVKPRHCPKSRGPDSSCTEAIS